MIPVISFYGRHNSGKTTLIADLLPCFEQRGLRVAVLKHSRGRLRFSQDTDAERLFAAGAGIVYAVSPEATLRYHRQPERTLADYLAELADSGPDLIILEGYKQENVLKIEVMRKDIDDQSLEMPGTLAIVSDFPLAAGLPRFSFDQRDLICDFIMEKLLRRT